MSSTLQSPSVDTRPACNYTPGMIKADRPQGSTLNTANPHPAPAQDGRLGCLTIPAESAAYFTATHAQRWIGLFLVLGCVARATRYFLRFPLWEDECFLGVNLFNRGYLELTQALDYHQVAPFLFLWLEKTVIRALGFHEMALRLPVFLMSLLSLWLFWHLSRMLFNGLARILSVAFFCVAYPGIRYAAEAKPYGCDLFVSLGLVTLFVHWWHNPAQRKWLRILCVCCPVAIGLSYPAVFTAAALSAIMLGLLLRRRLYHCGGAWVLYNLVLVGSLGLSYLVCMRHQFAGELNFMSQAWSQVAFPPLTSIWAFVKWLVVTHTGAMLAYPVGDARGGSTLTALFCGMALVFLVRRSQWTLSAMLVGPFVVQFMAAALRRYPYGGHVRMSIYAMPLICLMSGLGCALLISIRAKKKGAAYVGQWMVVSLVLLILIGVGSMVQDIAYPYKAASDMRARAFAQWFWPYARFDGEAVCIKDDLGIEFSRETWQELSWSAAYLCNKYIYGASPIVNTPRPQETRDPRARVLRCLLFRDKRMPFDQQAFDTWLTDMKAQYPYLGQQVYPFPRLNKRENRIVTIDYVEIYTFALEPKDAPDPTPAARSQLEHAPDRS